MTTKQKNIQISQDIDMRRKLVYSCIECTKDSEGLIVFCELCQIENDTNDRIFMEKFGNNPRTIEPDDY